MIIGTLSIDASHCCRSGKVALVDPSQLTQRLKFSPPRVKLGHMLARGF